MDDRTSDPHGSDGEPEKEHVSVYLARVQAHIFRRRVRTSEFFLDFDPLRAGRCTREQFGRAVASIIHPNLPGDLETPVNLEVLAENFVAPESRRHEPQVVDYTSFGEKVDEVFNIQCLEKKPNLEVPAPGASVPPMGSFAKRPVEDEKGLHDTLARVAMLTRSRGIDLASCFDDCHRSSADVWSGRIVPEDFAQHFPLAKATATRPAALSHHQVDLLIQRYIDENGFIRLFPFQREIEEHLGLATGPDKYKPISFCSGRPMSARRMYHIEESTGFPLQRPLSARPGSSIAGTSNASETTCAYSQRPAAGQRPGVGQRPQSARAGSLQRQTPASAQLDVALAGRPQPRRPASAAATGRRPASAHLDVALSARPQPRRPASAAAAGCRPQRLDAVGKIRKEVVDRRLRLYDAFRDTDILRRGVVGPSQLRAALTVLRVDLPAGDLETLSRRFGDESGDGGIRYPALCAEVAAGLPYGAGALPNGFTAAASNAGVDAALRDVSSGPQPQGLPRAGETPAAARMQSESEQASEADATAVAAEVQLRQAEAACRPAKEAEQRAAQEKRRQQKEVECIQDMVRMRVESRRIDILTVFQDFACTRWAGPGHVTTSQFSRAMYRMGIRLGEAKEEVLLQHYCDTELANEFNYIDFCAAIDPKLASAFASAEVRAQAARKLAAEKPMPRRCVHGNPYFDKAGRVRRFEGPLRPQSAKCGSSRPLGGSRFFAARPTARPIGLTG